MESITYTCAKCSEVIKPTPKVCPQCGGTKRIINMVVVDKIVFHDSIQGRLKRIINGKIKVIHKQKIGDSYHRDTKKWNFRKMIVDLLNNRYVETITDKETGEIIKHTDEKLSDHIGHGSAKKSN